MFKRLADLLASVDAPDANDIAKAARFAALDAAFDAGHATPLRGRAFVEYARAYIAEHGGNSVEFQNAISAQFFRGAVCWRRHHYAPPHRSQRLPTL